MTKTTYEHERFRQCGSRPSVWSIPNLRACVMFTARATGQGQFARELTQPERRFTNRVAKIRRPRIYRFCKVVSAGFVSAPFQDRSIVCGRPFPLARIARRRNDADRGYRSTGRNRKLGGVRSFGGYMCYCERDITAWAASGGIAARTCMMRQSYAYEVGSFS